MLFSVLFENFFLKTTENITLTGVISINFNNCTQKKNIRCNAPKENFRLGQSSNFQTTIFQSYDCHIPVLDS